MTGPLVAPAADAPGTSVATVAARSIRASRVRMAVTIRQRCTPDNR
jgi:hypothetical protein